MSGWGVGGVKQHKDVGIYPLSASLGTKLWPARAGAEAGRTEVDNRKAITG